MIARDEIKDWLPELMREWAEYERERHAVGYPDATPIWNAANNIQASGFGSRPPAGLAALSLTGKMRRLVTALGELLRDIDVAPVVRCTQEFYLYGHEPVCRHYSMSRTQLYERVKSGELLIKREMNRR